VCLYVSSLSLSPQPTVLWRCFCESIHNQCPRWSLQNGHLNDKILTASSNYFILSRQAVEYIFHFYLGGGGGSGSGRVKWRGIISWSRFYFIISIIYILGGDMNDYADLGVYIRMQLFAMFSFAKCGYYF